VHSRAQIRDRDACLVYNTAGGESVLLRLPECLGMKLHDLVKMRQEIAYAVIARIRMVLVLHVLLFQFVV